MEYFSLSPFYDRSCNNEILRMQGLLVDEVPVKSGDEYPMSMKMLLYWNHFLGIGIWRGFIISQRTTPRIPTTQKTETLAFQSLLLRKC